MIWRRAPHICGVCVVESRAVDGSRSTGGCYAASATRQMSLLARLQPHDQLSGGQWLCVTIWLGRLAPSDGKQAHKSTQGGNVAPGVA